MHYGMAAKKRVFSEAQMHTAVKAAVDATVAHFRKVLAAMFAQEAIRAEKAMVLGRQGGARALTPLGGMRAAHVAETAPALAQKLTGHRRAGADMQALLTVVGDAIHDHPGERAKEIAARLGLKPGDIREALHTLRRTDGGPAKIVAKGKKQGTRYWTA